MPYKDPEKQAEAMRRARRKYADTHQEEEARRKAKWYRENKEHANQKRREHRQRVKEEALKKFLNE